MRRLTWLSLALAAGLVVLGCGGDKKFATRGKVLKDGEPLKVGGDELVRVMFVPMPEDGSKAQDFFVATFNPDDSTFTAKGKDGLGIPPGKYRVSVEYMKGRKDAFNGAFDAVNSPFVFTIASSSDEVVVDVGKAAKK
jgi:hypothetical protein